MISRSRKCLECKEELLGRADKKFCSPYCKSAYHYRVKKSNTPSRFHTIDRQLKTNRRLLKIYNKSGKSIVRQSTLIQEGFDPRYFTHYWKTDNGQVYFFCYEYGYTKKQETNATKYLLVTWQAYMK